MICNEFRRIKLLHVGASSCKAKEWKYIEKNFSPWMVSILFWCRLLWNAFFLRNLKFQFNRSLPFFQGFSFIGFLSYTPKIRSLSQKLWPQAVVLERVQKILGYKIGKWILYNKKIKILIFLKISPIYYVLTMHFGTSTNFQHLNIVSIYLKSWLQ